MPKFAFGRTEMSDSDEVDEANLPPAAECDRRCQEFARITCTDSALAMFYLQDRSWDLQQSLTDYFTDTGYNSALPALPSFARVSSEERNTEAAQSVPAAFVDSEPHRIRILSWNIDGIDQNNVVTRTRGACKIILQEKPDVVFLQEVVNKSLEVLNEKCDGYQVMLGNIRGQPRSEGDYFTAMMLRKATTSVQSSDVKPFMSSRMMRTLLSVKAAVKGISCHLMTSHLESTKDHAAERLKQLKTAFKELQTVSENETGIFGGDLNMRDKEFDEVKTNGFADGIADIWEDTGSRPEARYTWNMALNDNLEMNGKFRPKCRFDRMYYRPVDGLKPVYFELVGLERLQNCRRFPSDHWGILAHFDKK